MATKCESVPAWFRKEHPIEVREDISFCAFSSDGEVGIMLGTGETDLEVKPEDVAFLFGKDKDELWFRPHFGSFYKVSFDSDEEATASRLYNQPTGVYRNLSLVQDVRFNVPVYHDALSMIPFDEPQQDNEDDTDDESTSIQPPRLKGMFPEATKFEKEIEKEVGEHLEATEASYAEIKEAVDKEVERYNGQVLVRYRPGNARLYSYDVIEINHRLLVIAYGELKDDWLSDEESFNGEPPLWFSESDHRVSPVFQAMKCRDFFRRELPNASIDSLVVLPKGCVVINDEEMQKTWRENCGTEMVRTIGIDETTLPTLREHLASLPIGDAEAPKYDVIDMAPIASRFSTEPENWITKE